jgi:tRNA (guanine37-N1)-methyltransferase
MQFDIVTLFPEMFRALTDWGITSRAAKQERYGLRTWNPRDFTTDNYRTIDDRPYGGGPGMVMLAKPLEDAIGAAKAAQAEQGVGGARVVMMSPQGATLNHDKVMRLAAEPGLILLCGRYEAIDQRLIDRVVDEEVSLGDFVLSGGELPAMALIDAVVRHLPGVLNDAQSAVQDSFVDGLLDCPHYTRPEPNPCDVTGGSRCRAGVVGPVLIRLPAGREVTKSCVSRSGWKATPQEVIVP